MWADHDICRHQGAGGTPRATMTEQTTAPDILVQDDGAIRTIRMNRPAKKNALTQPM